MIGGESRYLSQMATGSLTQAALGGESAGGEGSPEFDVCHSIPSVIPLVAIQPAGNAGGVTLSKLSNKLHAIGLGLAVGVGVAVAVAVAVAVGVGPSTKPRI